MNGISILIVDDDRLLVEKLENTVDWERLGISVVLTANNIRQAEDILKECTVQILLCDVDMPQGSGLELLDWIRGIGMEIECVFLSSYANFTYAQKAISLSASEYLLKPIANADLERVLKRVADSVREKRNVPGVQPEPSVCEGSKLWEKLLLRQDLEENLNGENAAESPYRPEEVFCLVIACVLPSTAGKTGKKELAVLDFRLRDSAAEFFREIEQESEPEQYNRRRENQPEAVVRVSDQEWVLVLQCREDWRTMKEEIRKLALHLRQQIDYPMAICVGSPAFCEKIPESLESLDAMLASVVMDEDEVIYEDSWNVRKKTVAAPWKVWEKELLETGNAARTEERILHYIEDQRKHDGWSRNSLSGFLRELEQMMYYYLNEYGYSYNQLFDEQEFEERERAAKLSVRKTKEFVLYIFEKLKGGRKAFTNQEEVVCRIKEYIESHLGENLSRAVLSREVFLSEGYLSQIFLKETGNSIPSYIAQRRIEKAKEYLEHSSLPVSHIAIEVGYNNFSYFSKTFRELVGCTPNEYRMSIDKKRNNY